MQWQCISHVYFVVPLGGLHPSSAPERPDLDRLHSLKALAGLHKVTIYLWFRRLDAEKEEQKLRQFTEALQGPVMKAVPEGVKVSFRTLV